MSGADPINEGLVLVFYRKAEQRRPGGDRVIRITAPHFVAGVVMERDDCDVTSKSPVERAITVAPIVNYMIGWSRERIERYCASKRWYLEEC